jgi:hypothetical protein
LVLFGVAAMWGSRPALEAAEFVVTAMVQASASTSYHVEKVYDGTDKLEISLRAESRYPIVELGDAFESDADCQFSDSRSINGGGNLTSYVSGPEGCSSKWTFLEDPATAAKSPAAHGGLHVGLDLEGDYGSWCGASVTGPHVITKFSENNCEQDDSMLLDFVQKTLRLLTEFRFDVPVKREEWSFTKTLSISTN